MELHYSQTDVFDTLDEAKFETPMELHYSQTSNRKFNRSKRHFPRRMNQNPH